VWRYQRGNQNLYIEKEQTTQWTKEKGQNDKQRSTKHTHKTKDRVTWIALKTGDELRCSGKVGYRFLLSPCWLSLLLCVKITLTCTSLFLNKNNVMFKFYFYFKIWILTTKIRRNVNKEKYIHQKYTIVICGIQSTANSKFLYDFNNIILFNSLGLCWFIDMQCCLIA
jgi:hypothetical protein